MHARKKSITTVNLYQTPQADDENCNTIADTEVWQTDAINDMSEATTKKICHCLKKRPHNINKLIEGSILKVYVKNLIDLGAIK